MVPFASQEWVELKYKNIPANTVTYNSSSIDIKVNQSASPLVHKLSEPLMIEEFDFQLKVSGEIPAKPNEKIGEDSFFRLGLVATGDKKLNWWEKKLASDWVLKLFSMAPKGIGLDKIYFFNVGSQASQLGSQRLHPKSDLMLEKIIAAKKTGTEEVLEVNHRLSQPLNVVALWISSDGDDTKSQFSVTLQKLSLKKSAP